jgi:hypothetical protein
VPPEFYTDENAGTRSVRRLLVGLGYVVHTPAQLYGSRDQAEGADQDWLARVGKHRWTVIGRDLKIYERPEELEAYKRARLQVFLLPGQEKAAELVELIEINLRHICAITPLRLIGTWRLTRAGPHPYDVEEVEGCPQTKCAGQHQNVKTGVKISQHGG